MNIKIFLTEYTIHNEKGTSKWSGPNILATSLEDAEVKVKIHNETAENKLTVLGELVGTYPASVEVGDCEKAVRGLLKVHKLSHVLFIISTILNGQDEVKPS